ncbi:MAG: ribonuclease H-like domain-containing protein [Chloroflexi bacterium]|nr:ribonuclease H-like domain-containing protein [Chloroflexota bacterium]
MSQHTLFGCDPTPGIVAVEADSCGRARVWRRSGDGTEATEHRFPNWFLATGLDLLAHLPAQHLTADTLRRAHGQLTLPDELAIVELDCPLADDDDDVYRYLVLTTNLDEIETDLVETANKRDGGDAQTLADLRGLIVAWPPIEQFLTLTGRTYFKGLTFGDVHRLQFDLETTGLNEDKDRIFMVSMRDSRGWHESLDTGTLSEGRLLERFVELVRRRDPDVLENHNIFAFDLPFLVKRAARLGVPLALGRDGSEPALETDIFDPGERPEPFLRWHITGREVIDTQQAVRRFSAAALDMRRHGLKDAARYFGFARAEREYVPGAEVWPTYRVDPERIRRYAADDVDEVDGLSRRLLPSAFGLATMLPRPYERIAADFGPTSLWELLLVRAYLHEGRAIVATMPRVQGGPLESRAELLLRGVVGSAARVALRPLLPRVVAQSGIAATNDALKVMPGVISRLLDAPADASTELLAATGHAYLAGHGLFADARVASAATRIARQYLDRVLAELRGRGCTIVEVDGEQVVFATPAGWTDAVEREVAQAVSAYLPAGVRLTHDGHYQALYARGPRSAIMLSPDGAVTLVGSTFRRGRLEPFGESFLHRAAPFALHGDARGLRRVYLETVHALRTAQLAVEELCVQVTLHKSTAYYRRGGTHEEPYEVLLAAGVRSWRVGQRIRYFRARGGEPRLLQEGDVISAAEADPEFYVQRLSSMYCQQFAQAFRREDFARIFRQPSGSGPFAEPDSDPELRHIRPIAEPTR